MHCVHLFCYFQVPIEVQEGWELPRYDMTNLYVAEYFNKEVYERVEGVMAHQHFKENATFRSLGQQFVAG